VKPKRIGIIGMGGFAKRGIEEATFFRTIKK